MEEGEKYAGDEVILGGVGGREGVEGWEEWVSCWVNEAISVRGALGRRMVPSCEGDWESRERGKDWTSGELKEVGGPEE